MENTAETKGFYEYKTTLRAMSEGVSLLSKNATMLLKATWPVLLVVSLLGAWCTYSSSRLIGCVVTGSQIDWSDLGLSVAFPVLVYLVGLVFFYALVYTLFAKYIEKGFMPTVVRGKFQPCPKITKLGRFVLGVLWVLFIVLVYGALSYVLGHLSKWTLILTVPVCIFLAFWLANQLTGYVLISDTLIGSIRHSFGITLKGLGSFLTVAIVLGLILGVIGAVCQLPSISSELIYLKSQLSLSEGDDVVLPSYFMWVYFLALAFSTFLQLILNAIAISSWSMVYGAVSARLATQKEAPQH